MVSSFIAEIFVRDHSDSQTGFKVSLKRKLTFQNEEICEHNLSQDEILHMAL